MLSIPQSLELPSMAVRLQPTSAWIGAHMPTGSRQHLVPQMMIRRFAGDDGKLAELHKPTLTLGTRRRSPKKILYLEDFYRDQLSDFDEDLLTPVEQRFSHYYPLLADEAKPVPLSGEGGAALVDWIAGMLVRTTAQSVLSLAVARKKGGLAPIAWALNPSLMNNIGRSIWFSELQDLLSRPGMRWKFRICHEKDAVVLSDHPVCQTNGIGAGGQVTIVPLSKHRVLFGGTEEALAHWNVPVDVLNVFLAGWAERSIFAADSSSLETVVRNLRGEGAIADPQWCDAARRPFFGFVDRLKDRPSLTDFDRAQWRNQIEDLYGRSILPDRRGEQQQSPQA